ncbi:MAG: dihydrodipicolinate synthase family protein [Verrucomicrobia bacterium]|nr:dihydrodipicolinate synthase family protein [Verrucomicrobiota bacterium]
MAEYPLPASWVIDGLRKGLVIPAHPLALTGTRKLDERRQRALTRYYHAAGAGGIAVGVHTTQFEIRRPEHGLFKPVLELAAGTVAACDKAANRKTIRIAGICGQTHQATSEAVFAREIGYDAGLLSLGAMRDVDDAGLIAHCEAVAREIPLMGFYLQPAAGGRLLSIGFWRRFAAIPNVVAIKLAPFNRYQTLDVVRGVAEAGRAGEIALYTGNDDNIVLDLLTQYEISVTGKSVRLGLVGGSLGHWACWTKKAVELLDHCRRLRSGAAIPPETLTLAAQVTDANAAFFDPSHNFAGCIAGIHEVLRRQGLLANILCLNPAETLSPGQAEEINRVYLAYPHLNDDEFVKAHLDEWLV